MTKTAIWNKETEEFLTQVIAMGATSGQASEELYNKFDMIFTRNSIISKTKRLKIEFIRGPKDKYTIGSINYGHAWKQKKIDNAEFIQAWNSGIKIHEIEQMFGIKRRSVYDRARKLNLKSRANEKFQLNRKSFTFKGDGKKELPKFTSRSTFPNPNAKSVSFIDLDWRGCRFVIGDGAAKDFLFCGARVPDGSDVPYCEHCRPIVYVMPNVKISRLVRNANIQ